MDQKAEIKYHTADDVIEAIEGLLVADKMKIRQAAEIRCRINRLRESPDELIQEAYLRLLIGEERREGERFRRWRTDRGFVETVCGAIKSIASGELTRQKREPAFTEISTDDESLVPKVAENASSVDPRDAREEDLQDHYEDLLKEVLEHFQGDQNVLDVIEGKDAKLTGLEVQEICGMTPNQYGAALKKLGRHLAQHFPKGMQAP